MNICVLYTGALRTIRKTMVYLKKNILLNENVHIFACLQNDTSLSDEEQTEWIRSELKNHLKSLHWFQLKDYPSWVQWRDNSVNTFPITDQWKQYLLQSGSMLEYFQLYLAYDKMCEYERLTRQAYGYIVRMRPDNMLAKPLDFHWLNWTDEQVESRLERIRQVQNVDKTNASTIHLFMTSLFDDVIIENLPQVISNSIWCERNRIPIKAYEVNNYLKTGSYILTIRKNNIYIVRRNLFHLIPGLAYLYGSLRAPHTEPGYWTNSESQFESACYYSGLNIHDYNTLFENMSLYQYDSRRYFDTDGNIINKYMVYCLVRDET